MFEDDIAPIPCYLCGDPTIGAFFNDDPDVPNCMFMICTRCVSGLVAMREHMGSNLERWDMDTYFSRASSAPDAKVHFGDAEWFQDDLMKINELAERLARDEEQEAVSAVEQLLRKSTDA